MWLRRHPEELNSEHTASSIDQHPLVTLTLGGLPPCLPAARTPPSAARTCGDASCDHPFGCYERRFEAMLRVSLELFGWWTATPAASVPIHHLFGDDHGSVQRPRRLLVPPCCARFRPKPILVCNDWISDPLCNNFVKTQFFESHDMIHHKYVYCILYYVPHYDLSQIDKPTWFWYRWCSSSNFSTNQDCVSLSVWLSCSEMVVLV